MRLLGFRKITPAEARKMVPTAKELLEDDAALERVRRVMSGDVPPPMDPYPDDIFIMEDRPMRSDIR